MSSRCLVTSGSRMAMAILVLLLCLASLSPPAWSATSQTYDFKVFLGKDEIGRQRFDVSSEGERTQVQVDAQFTGERLLNSQTGELQPVSIRVVGEETIPVLGVSTRTMHRRIVTDKFVVDLWYTLNGRWVALQSTTAKGDTLRYTLQ